MPTATDPPAALDLACYQRATFRKVLTWTADGEPVDLTGYTAVMTVRAGSGGLLAVLATLTVGSGITLGGAAGTITLTIAAAVTATFPDTKGEYDLILTAPDGTATALVAGRFAVTGSVLGAAT